MKLIIDMNLSPRWAKVLIDAGFEAVHWSAVGAGNTPDIEIMAYATLHGFVVLTHDLDFGAILAAKRDKGPSVVQVRADNVSPDNIGSRVLNALNQMRSDLVDGALVTIDTERVRLRVLSFRAID